jgi:hypothetical protein
MLACKHCHEEKPDYKELLIHVRSQHPLQYEAMLDIYLADTYKLAQLELIAEEGMLGTDDMNGSFRRQDQFGKWFSPFRWSPPQPPSEK